MSARCKKQRRVCLSPPCFSCILSRHSHLSQRFLLRGRRNIREEEVVRKERRMIELPPKRKQTQKYQKQKKNSYSLPLEKPERSAPASIILQTRLGCSSASSKSHGTYLQGYTLLSSQALSQLLLGLSSILRYHPPFWALFHMESSRRLPMQRLSLHREQSILYLFQGCRLQLHTYSL